MDELVNGTVNPIHCSGCGLVRASYNHVYKLCSYCSVHVLPFVQRAVLSQCNEQDLFHFRDVADPTVYSGVPCSHCIS